MEWIFPIVAAIVAVLTLILAQPSNKWLAGLTVFLILGLGGWQAYNAYQNRRTHLEISSEIDRVLYRQTRQYLTVLRDMIFYSSDGWLPSNEDEFFSRKTANLICNSLNINLEAPVLPKRTWRQWIAQISEKYRKELTGLFQNYAQSLNPELLNLIREVSGSNFRLWSAHIVLASAVDRQLGIMRRPTFCPGIEPLVEGDLGKIRALYIFVRRNETDNQKGDWKFLNMRNDNRWPRHLLGSDRIK
jgi:hypothetical protein